MHRSPGLLFVALMSLVMHARAHDGPPYPLCVDEVLGPVSLSIWADPDVGEGTFYFYLDPPDTDVQIEARAHLRGAPDTEVRAQVQAPEARAPYQQLGTVEFQQRGAWTMNFTLMSGDAAVGEIELEVDVTPPGMGRLYMVWYAIPFLAVAAVWLRIFLASRKHLPGSSLGLVPSLLIRDASASGEPHE